jgi:arylsulfatase A-like enzyme
MHQNFYFYKERPFFELYDLQNDPFELNNLSGRPELNDVEKTHREEMERKMVIDHDFLPMPVHVIRDTKAK